MIPCDQTVVTGHQSPRLYVSLWCAVTMRNLSWEVMWRTKRYKHKNTKLNLVCFAFPVISVSQKQVSPCNKSPSFPSYSSSPNCPQTAKFIAPNLSSPLPIYHSQIAFVPYRSSISTTNPSGNGERKRPRRPRCVNVTEMSLWWRWTASQPAKQIKDSHPSVRCVW